MVCIEQEWCERRGKLWSQSFSNFPFCLLPLPLPLSVYLVCVFLYLSFSLHLSHSLALVDPCLLSLARLYCSSFRHIPPRLIPDPTFADCSDLRCNQPINLVVSSMSAQSLQWPLVRRGWASFSSAYWLVLISACLNQGASLHHHLSHGPLSISLAGTHILVLCADAFGHWGTAFIH